jgi:DNA-directed RNA polymerase specialized sigma subunit, sigma24 homolog
MSISRKIKKYKETVSGLNAQELLAVFKNSRLSADERYAVELTDLYGKSIKEAANTMNTDTRQITRWMNKARKKIMKQVFKQK